MYELMSSLSTAYDAASPPEKQPRRVEFWKQEVIQVKEDLEDFYHIRSQMSKSAKQSIFATGNARRPDFFEIGRLKPTRLPVMRSITVISSNEFTVDLEEKIKYLEHRTAELKVAL